ncbi:MAG: 50S ribosomal protein L9 [Eubacteriales bacterium]|nr:50S ribosomal protein L9 [Eubacteriales bacterium]
MQVILTQDVKSLGKAGTLVNVNDSYARNYIIPRKLGVEASKANLNNLKLKNANEAKIEAAKVANAKDTKAAVDGKTVLMKVRTGEGGKLFGAVTSSDVAEAIKKEFGIDVDKKKIVMDPIKQTGKTEVTLKLHKEVNATVTVDVEGE